MFLCPKCGNPYEARVKYCPCCGNAMGDISVPNPKDTTFLYCAPAASPASAAQDAQGAQLPVSGVEDTTDVRIPVSGGLIAASLPEQISTARGFDTESVTPPDNTPTSPIWVTRSINQPITGPLDESFLDDPSINTPTGEDSYAKKINQSYISRVGSSTSANADVDIFDEVFETTSLIYSNMPPKVKKFIIITLITTLLSIIPIIYVACSQQKGPGLSKDIQASLTDDWAASWNADSGT